MSKKKINEIKVCFSYLAVSYIFFFIYIPKKFLFLKLCSFLELFFAFFPSWNWNKYGFGNKYIMDYSICCIIQQTRYYEEKQKKNCFVFLNGKRIDKIFFLHKFWMFQEVFNDIENVELFELCGELFFVVRLNIKEFSFFFYNKPIKTRALFI